MPVNTFRCPSSISRKAKGKSAYPGHRIQANSVTLHWSAIETRLPLDPQQLIIIARQHLVHQIYTNLFVPPSDIDMADEIGFWQIARGSWELFLCQNPWVKKAFKLCLCILCPPCYCCYALMPTGGFCGNARMQKQRAKFNKMTELQVEKRERQPKRRKSLTGEPSAARKLDDILRVRERWCDQRASILFSKLPGEICMHIYVFVLQCKRPNIH